MNLHLLSLLRSPYLTGTASHVTRGDERGERIPEASGKVELNYRGRLILTTISLSSINSPVFFHFSNPDSQHTRLSCLTRPGGGVGVGPRSDLYRDRTIRSTRGHDPIDLSRVASLIEAHRTSTPDACFGLYLRSDLHSIVRTSACSLWRFCAALMTYRAPNFGAHLPS